MFVEVTLIICNFLFQRSHNEYSENAEFVEIERQMLLEANKELEAEVLMMPFLSYYE
jgi:hypothetical protein